MLWLGLGIYLAVGALFIGWLIGIDPEDSPSTDEVLFVILLWPLVIVMAVGYGMVNKARMK